MRIAATSLALVIVVAYLAIPIDMKKVAVAIIAGIGLLSACLHILRYGRLIETYVHPNREVEQPQESFDMENGHVA